jgi:hypothetical protein
MIVAYDYKRASNVENTKKKDQQLPVIVLIVFNVYMFVLPELISATAPKWNAWAAQPALMPAIK